MFKDVPVDDVRTLLALLEGDKSKVGRQLRRQCRKHLKKVSPAPTVRRDGGKVSEQTGIADKWIIPTI